LSPDELISEQEVIAELAQLARALPISDDEELSLSQIVERHLTSHFAEFGEGLPPAGLYDRVLQEIEKPLLAVSLAATRGNQIRTAELLGLNRNTLRKKIRELGVEVIRGLSTR
jgi:two-component system nitrogen regulation response regulator GlnG